MQHAFVRTVLCAALVGLLAACGGSDDNGGSNSNGVIQSQFGDAFEAAFDQPATAEAVAVTATSLGPVSFTTDPIAIP